jgi:hypothetical protein
MPSPQGWDQAARGLNPALEDASLLMRVQGKACIKIVLDLSREKERDKK